MYIRGLSNCVNFNMTIISIKHVSQLLIIFDYMKNVTIATQ